MKISVITVTYNSAATIADTLKSVAAQTYPNIEHIVVDGESTDNTLALIHEHGMHVAKLVSERDSGIYDAMNKGLRLATGDFVGFLNSDDFFAAPDTVQRMIDSMKEADIIYGDLVYVEKERTSKIVRYWRSGEFVHDRLRFGWMPPHPTFYVRRSHLEKVGTFDLRLRIAADYDFMLRFLSQPSLKVAYLPQVLVKMRTGGGSNHSLKALLRKSSEDFLAIRKNKIGGPFTLLCKNARKLSQYLTAPTTGFT